jgi:hypothetical protein
MYNSGCLAASLPGTDDFGRISAHNRPGRYRLGDHRSASNNTPLSDIGHDHRISPDPTVPFDLDSLKLPSLQPYRHVGAVDPMHTTAAKEITAGSNSHIIPDIDQANIGPKANANIVANADFRVREVASISEVNRMAYR